MRWHVLNNRKRARFTPASVITLRAKRKKYVETNCHRFSLQNCQTFTHRENGWRVMWRYELTCTVCRHWKKGRKRYPTQSTLTSGLFLRLKPPSRSHSTRSANLPRRHSPCRIFHLSSLITFWHCRDGFFAYTNTNIYTQKDGVNRGPSPFSPFTEVEVWTNSGLWFCNRNYDNYDDDDDDDTCRLEKKIICIYLGELWIDRGR